MEIKFLLIGRSNPNTQYANEKKQLRALLVAGFLSLVPAVTLTSCSGGGGGGGVREETISAATFAGKTIVIVFSTSQETIKFGSGGVAEGILAADDGRSWSNEGEYEVNAAAGRLTVELYRKGGGLDRRHIIDFAVENGQLVLQGSIAQSPNPDDKDVRARSVRFL